MSKYEIGLELMKDRWRQADDAEKENILLEMKREGLSMIDAIRALTMSRFYSLGEAKEYISHTTAWRKEAESGKALHEIAWQALDDFANSQTRYVRVSHKHVKSDYR